MKQDSYKWPWISVYERMPEAVKRKNIAFYENEKCMVLLNGRRVKEATYIRWEGHCHWRQFATCDVTHWMPYPDANGANQYWTYD